MIIVEWIVSSLVNMAIAPLASAIMSIMIPSSVILAFFIYNCACRRTPSSSMKSSGTGSFHGTKLRPTRTVSSCSMKDYMFMIFLGLFTAIWIFAHCTLLQHLYRVRLNNLKAAEHADDLCGKMIYHPGRQTDYIADGCKKADHDLDVDPLGEAVRQWVDLFFSFSIFPSEDLGVTVPFGVTRFVFIAMVILFMREWVTPMVTWVQSNVNRLRVGPTSAGAA